MDFLLSGVAACGACLFTNPLEVVKTRMQLQGELRAPGTYTRHYRNVFHAFYTIGRVDGLAALQRGLMPALLYQFGFNGIRLGTYGMVETASYIHASDGRVSPLRTTVAGALAGAMAAIASSPIYLVKTHIQAQSAAEIAVGHQYQHQGMFHALTMIHKEHGILGLWRGAISSVPRVMVGSATQLATFSSAKEFFQRLEVFPKDSWLVALSAGMVSSFTVALAMSPFDVASTRLYNQPVGPEGQGLIYKGLLDCLAKIIRSEGFLGVYKGLGACYFRIGPHTILSLLFWNELRQNYARWAQKR
ncbi:solute carrier family 25 member 35 [Anolis carolinensis]|uniref:Solute carrier family 25 member 35 n=1 Tax=Anolis carolinensis TaxID=28377 RepID=H9G7S0_ANOCA|nr:PREDICTED: solute carrier family 25 member 35 [Anolis carolinensis]|eukprot:XP_003227282.1 PREDICTED: solute carrier family 25 member 35 [Anolis carolinensis]